MKSAAVMIAAAMVLLLGSLAAAWFQHQDPSSSGPSSGSTVLLLDCTGKTTPEQWRELSVRLRAVGEGLRRGEKLTVYTLSGGAQAPHELCRLISPGQGAEANHLTEGSDVLERLFDRQVRKGLDTLVTAAAQSDTSSRSAILEALWQLGTYTDFARESGPRRLVVVSDLLQNTPGFSFYRPGDGSLFTTSGSLRDPSWEVRLEGVSVEVLCLLRPGDEARQGPAFLKDWVRYFEHCGASATVSVVAI